MVFSVPYPDWKQLGVHEVAHRLSIAVKTSLIVTNSNAHKVVSDGQTVRYLASASETLTAGLIQVSRKLILLFE